MSLSSLISFIDSMNFSNSSIAGCNSDSLSVNFSAFLYFSKTFWKSFSAVIKVNLSILTLSEFTKISSPVFSRVLGGLKPEDVIPNSFNQFVASSPYN